MDTPSYYISLARTMVNRVIRVLHAVAALALAGCGPNPVTIQIRLLPQRNPTTYEFNASIDEVKKAIRAARGTEWLDRQPYPNGASLAWKEDSNPFAMILQKPGNEQDAYLYGLPPQRVGASKHYLINGKELSYYADFHIHLVPLNPTRTRVQIFTLDARVVVGKHWYPAHGDALMFVDVEPTSIEEYQILLDIGAKLGVRDMPSLISPGAGSPPQQEQKIPHR